MKVYSIWANRGLATVTGLLVAVVTGAGATRSIPQFLGNEITTWILLFIAMLTSIIRWHPLLRMGIFRINRIESSGVAILLIAIVGSIWLSLSGGIRASGTLRIVNHLVLLYAISSLPAETFSIRFIIGGLIAGLGLQVLVGTIELCIGRTFYYSLWKPIEAATWNGFLRIGSTPADPNYLALGLVSFLSVTDQLIEFRKYICKLFLLILRTACIMIILLTFSRAGYIGLVLYVLLRMTRVSKLKRVRAFFFIAFLAVTVPLLAPNITRAVIARILSARMFDASMIVRIAAQRAALSAFIHHPFLGIGYDRFVTTGPKYLLDLTGISVKEINVLNSYLLVAVEGGVFSFFLYIHITFRAYRSAAIVANRSINPYLKRIASALTHSVIIWSILSLSLDSIHSPLQWILLGLCVLVFRVYYEDERRKEASTHVKE